MINAQEYLDQNYPKGERKNALELNLNNKNLEGCLDLRDFVNLEILDCSENSLTSINLSNNRKISWIECSDNLLTDIDFYHQDSEKVEGICIQNNNLSSRDLSCFSRFVNLGSLMLGTDNKEKLEQNIYNRFHGSLAYLEDLDKLQELDINGTDINGGLEYLSLNKLKSFYCASKRVGARVEEIKNILDLSEEEAENESRAKINKIGAYQAYFRWQQSILEMQQVQNLYFQSANELQRAITQIRHKLDNEHLQMLLNFQKRVVYIRREFPTFFQSANDRLRHIKQELVEDFEELTKGEIDNLCRVQIQFIEARILFSQTRQQRGMNNLIQACILLRR